MKTLAQLAPQHVAGAVAAAAAVGVCYWCTAAGIVAETEPEPEPEPAHLATLFDDHQAGSRPPDANHIREVDELVLGRVALLAQLLRDHVALDVVGGCGVDGMVADLDSCLEHICARADAHPLRGLNAILGLAQGPLLKAAGVRPVLGMWACRMLLFAPERYLTLDCSSLSSIGGALRAASPDGDGGCAAATLLLKLSLSTVHYDGIIAAITLPEPGGLLGSLRHAILHAPEQASIRVLLATLRLRLLRPDLGSVLSNVAVAAAIMPRSLKHARAQQPVVRACAALLAYADSDNAATELMITKQHIMSRTHANMLLVDGLRSQRVVDVADDWSFDFEDSRRSLLLLEGGLTTGPGAEQALRQLEKLSG